MLKPGGRFLFNVWDRLDRNPVTAAVAGAVAALFPDDPPSFFERVPFGYHDKARIEADLRAAGFTDIAAETVEKTSRVVARDAATGLCQGTPLRAEIEERGPARRGGRRPPPPRSRRSTAATRRCRRTCSAPADGRRNLALESAPPF